MKDETSWVVLFLRLSLGMIFFTLGLTKVFQTGIIAFAENVFVKGYAETWLPEPLLWVAGVIDPLAMLIGGALLIAGLFTRWTCVGLGAFMLMIIFGLLVKNPFDVIGHVSTFLAMILFILYLAPKGNRFSLDNMIQRR